MAQPSPPGGEALASVEVTSAAPPSKNKEYTCDEVRRSSACDEAHLPPVRAAAALTRRCAQHLLSLEEVGKKYGTSLNTETPNQSQGLASGEIEALRERFGKNVLTPPKLRPLWLQFLLKVRR